LDLSAEAKLFAIDDAWIDAEVTGWAMASSLRNVFKGGSAVTKDNLCTWSGRYLRLADLRLLGGRTLASSGGC
jgi:hypothetical protein